MTYREKVAKKNKLTYTLVDTIYIGDFGTKLENTGNGTYRISSPHSTFNIDKSGNINIWGSGDVDISGSSSVKLGGKRLNFTELPNRFVRPSGISWSKVTSHSNVIGVIPIKVGTKNAYIPFLDIDVGD